MMFLLYEEKSTVSSNKQTAKSFSFYSVRLLYRRTITFFWFYQSLIDPPLRNIIYSFSVCKEFHSIVWKPLSPRPVSDTSCLWQRMQGWGKVKLGRVDHKAFLLGLCVNSFVGDKYSSYSCLKPHKTIDTKKKTTKKSEWTNHIDNRYCRTTHGMIWHDQQKVAT